MFLSAGLAACLFSAVMLRKNPAAGAESVLFADDSLHESGCFKFSRRQQGVRPCWGSCSRHCLRAISVSLDYAATVLANFAVGEMRSPVLENRSEKREEPDTPR